VTASPDGHTLFGVRRGEHLTTGLGQSPENGQLTGELRQCLGMTAVCHQRLLRRDGIAMAHAGSDEAVNPIDPRNILGATRVLASLSGETYNKTYTSTDGGHLWTDTTPPEARGGDSADPRALFTNRGTALFVSLNNTMRRAEIYRSTDGGLHWRGRTNVPGFDHELITVDRSHGRYSNRVYLAGEASIPSKDAPPGMGGLRIIRLYTSDDDGRSFPLSSIPATGTHFCQSNPFSSAAVGVVWLQTLDDVIGAV